MKKVQVIWSSEALVDLEVIYDFLFDKSEHAAKQVVESILNRTRQVENFPESGAIQESLNNSDKNYRYLVEGNIKSFIVIAPTSKLLSLKSFLIPVSILKG